MKFPIKLSGKTLYTFMREVGYAPAYSTGNSDEFVFQRFLAGSSYPKFHMYCVLAEDKKSATLNLHLDQKRPSYQGSHAHNAEHSGPVMEAEIRRIQSVGEASRIRRDA